MSMLGKMLGFGRNEHYDRGIRLFDQGLYAEAIAELEQARVSKKGRRDELTERLALFYTGESYAHLGHQAMKNGQWEKAQECFYSALDIHPHYADLHFHLALAQRAGGQLDMALCSLNNALSINPKFAKAHFYRGLLHYQLGEAKTGITALRAALEFEPGFHTEAYTRGIALHEAGDFEAALRSFEQVSHTEVDDILFHYKLGDDLLRRALYADAVEEYNKALSLNPNYADIRNHLGIAYSALGQPDAAITEFQAALAINPRFVDAMLNLAFVLRDNGRTAEARSYFEQALAVSPDNTIAQSGLSELAQAVPQRKAA